MLKNTIYCGIIVSGKRTKRRKENIMSKANAELKAITREYNRMFRTLSEDEYNEKLLALKPGENAPVKGKLTGARRERMEQKAAECRSKAADILNRELAAVNKKITAAPSTEAVNTITLLNMRDEKTITPELVYTLLDEYGDNVQSYEAIKDIAKRKGVKGLDGVNHPLREQQANIEALNKSLYKNFSLTHTEQNEDRSSEGFEAFIGMTIDQTFAPDPE